MGDRADPPAGRLARGSMGRVVGTPNGQARPRLRAGPFHVSALWKTTKTLRAIARGRRSVSALKRLRALDVRVGDRLRMPDKSLQRVDAIRLRSRSGLGRSPAAELFFLLENHGFATRKPDEVVQVAMRTEPSFD